MEKIVNLNILGQDIRVKSPGGEEEAKRVASYLDEKIRDVKGTSETAGTLRLLLYAAFQIADENIRMADKLVSLEKDVEVAFSRMIEMIK